jgi:hypothetical protein
MPQVFDTNGNIPTFDEISCGIYINRGQPLLKTHLGCIEQIAGFDKERTVLLLIGSSNKADKFFSPIENPLNFNQRKEQLEIALFGKNIKYKIDSLPDVGDQEKWLESVKESVLLNGFNPKKTAYCYFKKEETYKKSSKKFGIESLDSYSEKIKKKDINIWRLRNADESLNNLSATPFRSIDLFSENQEIQQKIADNIVVPDFIKNLVMQARNQNKSSDLLNELKIPKTMFDLTLIRLEIEANISTKSLLENINLKQNPQLLYKEILTKIHQ